MDIQTFDELPWRLFLDSSTLQALHSYGEFIYDGGCINPNDKIWRTPHGPENIQALEAIMFVGQRASFELVLSANSLDEVDERHDASYSQWAIEVMNYWETLLAGYREQGALPFEGLGISLAAKLESTSFGYLSKKDRALLSDAVVLECDAFITLDLKLCRNANHLESQLSMRILEPRSYWRMLKPWARLFV